MRQQHLTMIKDKITIIGIGRFGQTLLRLLSGDFDIIAYDEKPIDTQLYSGVEVTKDLSYALESGTIFLAIPISQLESFLLNNRNMLKGKFIIDVMSVKVYPKKLYKKILGLGPEVLLTHPMFGPDSSKDGFDDLPIVMDKNTATSRNYNYWKEYFEVRGLKVIEMKAEVHDKIVAKSQATTHIIGRVLRDFGYLESPINTKGDQKMLEIIQQTCNDNIDLFHNMQNKNPYTKAARKKLTQSIGKIFKSVVEASYDKTRVTKYGIQGGQGSFNDVAIHKYFIEKGIKKYEIVYLHTTKRVLDALDQKLIDLGLFAVSNSRGGIVEETTEELGKHSFSVEAIINISIKHYILGVRGEKKENIGKIMAHPQVFKQCQMNLKNKYPNADLFSGKGKAIDNAKAAELLAQGKLSEGTVVMGSKLLADIYDLEILDSNLQDDPHNTTNFLLVK